MPPTDFSRTQAPRLDWLALAAPEPVLDPAQPIIDTHMHLWHHHSGYRYFVEDMAQEIAASGHNIVSTLYVECKSMYRATGPEALRPVGETEFAAGQGAIADSGKYTSARIAEGIVGYADLTLGPALGDVLDAHIAAGNGRFRGIRMRAKWDPDPQVKGAVSADAPHLYLEPRMQDGLRALAKRGLVFEASIYHPQIADVAALARAVPEAQIVLIHTGSPVGHSSYAGRQPEELQRFTSDIRDLALCPNVSVKLGGILMTLAAFDFGKAPRPIGSAALLDLWRPYLETCIEAFGPKRAMVSSNFPVDKAGYSYGCCWNMFKRLCAAYSETERQEIFASTAARIYGLRDPHARGAE